MSVQRLTQAIKSAVDNRIQRETRALRGKIFGGLFQSGSKSFPYRQAVDCNTKNGSRVWAQLAPNGTAVIVGA